MQPQKPLKPTPPPKGPYEKRGGIPREKFSRFLKEGPYSIPWSRRVMPGQRKQLGEKLLKERFPRGIYGPDVSGSEIQREIVRLRKARFGAKTQAERNALTQDIVRLEEAKKRAGL